MQSELDKIIITEEDIDDVELLFGDVKFDEERRAIIKNMRSTDIQAFPGAGKTTVLVAKLAILAKKWPYDNRGICVLSHTNVAREEIENRLGKTEVGKKLLSYPHFIGTLHSFCDVYIGMPWLKSQGYSMKIVDTETVLGHRWRSLSRYAKEYLERKKKDEYCCESIDFPVKINIGCSEEANSYKAVKKCIEQSQKNGNFTFNEMLYVARYGLKHCDMINASIQRRFPILLIDEAQDMSDTQWELISLAFPEEKMSMRQAFGDANQAIFQSVANKNITYSFPQEDCLMMQNSHRFGKDISDLIDSLGIRRQGMNGEYCKYKNRKIKHTIFLYEKENIEKVLPAYASHILECFSDEELDENKKLGCYLVGMVHNTEHEGKESKKFPLGLIDYWSEYKIMSGKVNSRVMLLCEYFQKGKMIFNNSGNYDDYINIVAESIRKIVNIKNDAIVIAQTGNSFKAILNELTEELKIEFRKDFSKLIELPFSCISEWKVVVKQWRKIVGKYFCIELEEGIHFFDWMESENLDQNPEKLDNIYHFQDEESGRKIDVQLASIHSVKGKTHLATMVVETFWYDHNIKSILPWLGNWSTVKPGKRDETRLKCHYVALTRARGLVCIAIPKDLVTDDQILMLNEKGWNVQCIS